MDMDFFPGGEHFNMDDTTLTPAFNLYSGDPQQQHACLTANWTVTLSCEWVIPMVLPLKGVGGGKILSLLFPSFLHML